VEYHLYCTIFLQDSIGITFATPTANGKQVLVVEIIYPTLPTNGKRWEIGSRGTLIPDVGLKWSLEHNVELNQLISGKGLVWTKKLPLIALYHRKIFSYGFDLKIFNPNGNGQGRIFPRPVWTLIALKKLYCEKFEKISIPPLGSSISHTYIFNFIKPSFSSVF